MTVRQGAFRARWEAKAGAVGLGGGFWVSHLKTALDQGTDARWVQTHGGAASSNILPWFPQHLGKQTGDSYPDRETEAQHQLMNRSGSFQSQTITTIVLAPAQPPPAPKLLFMEQNCISDAVDGARFAAGPRHPRLPGFFFFFPLALAPACVAGPTRWHCVTAAPGLCHPRPRETFGVQALDGGRGMS